MLQIRPSVLQDSDLGPLLFIVHMNGIAFVGSIDKLVIYADDITLYSILSSFNIKCNSINNVSENINSELNNIIDWLKLSKLSLNPSNSKCMMFHMSQKLCKCPKDKIDQVEIEQVKEFNFLRIIIDEQLNWKSRVEYMSCKITRTMIC